MRLVSPLLRRVVYPALSGTACLRRFGNGAPVILTYHGVLPPGYESIDRLLDGALLSASRFRAHLRWLKARYSIVSPDLFRDWLRGKSELPERAAFLTCDDGLVNNLSDMLPVLQEEGVSCLFFVTEAAAHGSSRMLWYDELYLMFIDAKKGSVEFSELGVAGDLTKGKRSFWIKLVQHLSGKSPKERDDFLDRVRERAGLPADWESKYRGHPARYRRFYRLSIEELRRLAEGGMHIGAHTSTHPILARSSDASAWEEIAESRRTLEKVLGTDIWAFAYPFGDPASVTNRELDMVQRAKYECAFLNSGGRLNSRTSHFAIPRVHVTAEMTLGELEAHLIGFHDSVKARLAREV